MTKLRSEFMTTVTDRGFVHQCTDTQGLDRIAAEGTIAAYIGFDCTAPSLHVGSMVSIMLLRHLQRAGHRPIVLMGGGTSKVGDPSGRDQTRKLMTDAEIDANMASIRKKNQLIIPRAGNLGAPPPGRVGLGWFPGSPLPSAMNSYPRALLTRVRLYLNTRS